jgi:hypothetical protein
MMLGLAPLLAAAVAIISTPINGLPNGNCRWVDGRLSAYNGTPTFRIWPKGTKRLFGVIARSGEAESADVLPARVSRLAPSFDRDIWGSFRVCPQTADRAGWMRMVVVVDARRLRTVER